ncbi:hypothetical protein PHYBOEH_004704 [Phytophthora boehmeriae]|uniref:Uncharacterized protein n=1 Tax=Phytophthora boehmeriae TaxID=109152 RepID=A0A8T1WQD3_9STRA|nr:hypothetical protein PHYBOEH_004704 [Phytophthora boehmeriae]
MATTTWTVEIHDAVGADRETLQTTSVRSCPEYSSAKTFLQSHPPVGLSSVDNNVTEDILEKLKSVTEQLVVTLLDQWKTEEDGMLSVLWWSVDNASKPCGQDYCIAVHICLMPQPKCLSSTVLIYGEGRGNARCKHTQWIADRAPIENFVAQLVEDRGLPIHEVVLSEPGPGGDRLLLEGLITNFFVVKEGTLFTAGEGVLEGSTRELVLKACKDLSIHVVLEAPKLSERESWQAAFVTSTVRVVIDVTRVLCGENIDDDKCLCETRIPSDTTGFTKRIRDQIFAQRMYLQ